MRKSRFAEAQIVAILQEGEAGLPVAELLRKRGVSRPTYYSWRSRYRGATVVNGIMGPRTRAAVIAFQWKRKMRVTGRLDTWMKRRALEGGVWGVRSGEAGAYAPQL